MFSKLNFIVPLNSNDKNLKIRNTNALVVHMIKDPSCTTIQNGVNIFIKQRGESNTLTLNFSSADESEDAHVILRNNLILLSNNLGVIPGPGPISNVAFNFGDWQDSVRDFVNILPPTPGDSERYIAKSAISLTTVYDVIADSPSVITVPANSILHYWDAVTRGTTNGGWIVVAPKSGMFTNVDVNANMLIKWGGLAWLELNWALSKDFKIESPVLTTTDGQYTGISPLDDVPAGNVCVEVKVNGIDTIIGDGCNATSFLTPYWDGLFAKQYTFVSAIGGTIVISGTHDLTNTDSLIIVDNGIIKCLNITNVTGNTLTVSAPVVGTVTSIRQPKKWGNIKQGDILLWFGSSAGYQLDPVGDKVVFKYITHN